MISLHDVECLRRGEAPESEEAQSLLSGHFSETLAVISEECVHRYVSKYGSRVKFFVGSEGCGKTLVLKRLGSISTAIGFESTYISLRESSFKLNDVQGLFHHIVHNISWEEVFDRIVTKIALELGFELSEITKAENDVVKLLESSGLQRIQIRKEVREAVASFTRNYVLPVEFHNFLYVVLRSKILDGTNFTDSISHRWLRGEKLLGADKKSIGQFQRIQKKNALLFLYSVVEIIKMSGKSGICILLDDFDVFDGCEFSKTVKKYTRNQVKDAWEVLRQLIDAADDLPGVFVGCAMRHDLMKDPDRGLKSYDALWMRVQTGIVLVDGVNPSADLLDVDVVLGEFDQANLTKDLVNGLTKVLQNADAKRSTKMMSEPVRTTHFLRQAISKCASSFKFKGE